MQADLLACAACGMRNILFVTGDPPKLGNYPHATGVFDTDSIGMAACSGGSTAGSTSAVLWLDPCFLNHNLRLGNDGTTCRYGKSR